MEKTILAKLKGIASNYKYFLDNIRCVQDGKIYNNSYGRSIDLTFKQLLPQENKYCNYFIKILEQNGKFCQIGNPVVLPSEIKVQSISPSGKKSLILRTVEKDNYLDLWSEEMLINSKKVTDQLSQIYNDDLFGRIEWNQSETKCIFIGEKSAKQYDEFFDVSKDKPIDSNKKDSEEDLDKPKKLLPNEKFDFDQDFGENCKDKKDPTIFILNCEDLALTEIKIDSQFYPATPKFYQNDNEVLCIGFVKEHAKIGILYCFNRHSSLLYLKNLESKSPQTVTLVEGYCVIGPRFSPDFKKIFFFYMDKKMMAHNYCLSLASIDLPALPNSKIEVIVPIIEECFKDSLKFQGIYADHDSYNSKCGFVGQNFYVFTTENHFSTKSYIVNTNTKEINELFSEETQKGYCFRIITLKDNSILYCKSNTQSFPEYYLCNFDPITSKIISNKLIYKCEMKKPSEISDNIQDISKNLTSKLFTFGEAEAILVYRLDKLDKGKIIFFLHGGPHSNFNNEFGLTKLLYMYYGYSLCFINYRGSLGYGQKFATSLIGKVGEFDLDDCHELIKQVMNTNIYKEAKEYLIGGSHGGYLGLKLIEDERTLSLFSAAILRNPVNNLFDMITSTDIPDWVTKECLSKDLDEPLNQEDILKLFSISPTRKVENVKTPLLLLIGANDRRVGCTTGLYYARLMKKFKKICKVVYIPDVGHGLMGAESEIQNIVNTIMWLEEH